MTRSTTRRRYLSAAGGSGLAALAGCTDLLEDIDSDDEEPIENEEERPSNESENGGESNESDGDGASNESGASATEDEADLDDVEYRDPDGSVSFVTPTDGDTVTNPVQIEGEVENFELQPAGEDAEQGQGHLHVLVDVGCVPPTDPILQNEPGYHHLSEGQREVELELEPGDHDLCLQLSDALHVAYDLTDEISVTVEEGDGGEGNETGNEDDGANETDGG